MTLSDSIIVAMIAGGVSIIVSLTTAWLTFRATRKRFKMEVAEKYADRLYTLRLEHYPTAFAITGRIQFDPARRSTSEELHAIREQLRSWWVGPAALLLSRDAIRAYYGVEEVLKRLARGESFDRDNASALFTANRAFRLNLRKDLAIIYAEVEPERAFEDE